MSKEKNTHKVVHVSCELVRDQTFCGGGFGYKPNLDRAMTSAMEYCRELVSRGEIVTMWIDVDESKNNPRAHT
jgi:hypothetical protein